MPVNRQTLTILQRNVQTWNTKRHTLANIYNSIDPDKLLLNETSVKNTDHLKILNYNVFKANKRNEQFAGAAIAIKKNITAQIEDDYYQDFISATIQTEHGCTVATGYIPPRQAYINSIDLNKSFNRRHPAYLVGDLNAYHRTFGYSNNNLRGKQVVTLINANKCKHIGPFFDTRITANTTRKPDIALTNKQAHLNTYLKAGPLTPSDHQPIIMKISTNPIQIPITPRLQFRKKLTGPSTNKLFLTSKHQT